MLSSREYLGQRDLAAVCDCSLGAINASVNNLLKEKYIDEVRYCQAFTHDKILYQGWGRIKIRAALYAKHLPSACIAQALDSIDESAYSDTLKRVIATKKRAIKSNDPMAREKLIRFCLQRGFTYEEISQHL